MSSKDEARIVEARLGRDRLSAAATTPVTEAQRRELRRRLAEYHANPDEPVLTLADIRRKFTAS